MFANSAIVVFVPLRVIKVLLFTVHHRIVGNGNLVEEALTGDSNEFSRRNIESFLAWSSDTLLTWSTVIDLAHCSSCYLYLGIVLVKNLWNIWLSFAFI